MPKLSVVIPVFGVEKYIKRCARSLFLQNLPDIEFIFVDDCTPDRSIEVLRSVIDEYQSHISAMNWKIRIERMPMNSGQAAVRQYGVKLATGDYVTHCDSDDWLEPEAYLRMYNEAISGNLDLLFCDFYKSSDTIRVHCARLGNVLPEKDVVLKAMLTGVLPSHSIWSVMCRRSLYDNITFPTGAMAEDWCMVFQLLFLSDSKLGYVREPLYNYYVNAESISFNPRQIKDSSIVDKRIRNCRYMVDNCNIVIGFLDRMGATSQYEKLYVNTKLRAKRLLCRMVNDKKVYQLWCSIYPEIKGHVLFNRHVTMNNRMMYLTTYLRIYPLLTRLFLK